MDINIFLQMFTGHENMPVSNLNVYLVQKLCIDPRLSNLCLPNESMTVVFVEQTNDQGWSPSICIIQKRKTLTDEIQKFPDVYFVFVKKETLTCRFDCLDFIR